MSSFNHALVSVIIPFLNGGKWLAEAIESVISQSYPYWEAILIDDGSEKETTEIALQYSFRYQGKIIYTEHEGHINKGVTASRNRGISMSKGSFIAFLDADDCWLNEKLLQQMALFKHYTKAEMICEASLFWYSWNNPDAKDTIMQIGTEQNRLYKPGELTKILYPLGEGQPPCPTGIVVKKSAFERSGGFEESFAGIYQLYEDQAFLSKIYLREKVYISAVANNLYRKRPGSLTESGSDEEHYKKVRLYFLNWLEQYLQHNRSEKADVMELITLARLRLHT